MKQDELFEKFCNTINDFYLEDDGSSIEETIDVIFSFFDEIIKKGAFKDEFKYSYSFGPAILSTYATSVKTKCKYELQFNYWEKQLYLGCYIQYPYNIKNLQEKFLLEFLTFINHHGFEYKQNSRSPIVEDKYPDLHKSFKSNTFKLMRNYFLYISEHGDFKDSGLGEFKAKWNFDKDIETIFEEACSTMKWFYKFNYNLWKTERTKDSK